MTLHRLRDLQNEFFKFAGELVQKLSTPRNRLNIKDVIHMLERTTCDEEALWLLRNRNARVEIRVDGYWTSKHEYVKKKLVEKLANRFHDLHIPAEIVFESPGPTARQDILVTVKEPDGSTKKRIVLEIKTGYGLDFNQLERLLWDNSAVVLIRAETGHATTLRANRYDALLTESLRNKIDRVRRLIEGHSYMIQGRDCSKCANQGCPLSRRVSEPQMVVLRDEDFDTDLDGFLRTLPSTMNKAVDLVIHEV